MSVIGWIAIGLMAAGSLFILVLLMVFLHEERKRK